MIIIRKQMVINANSFIFFSYTNDFYFILLKKKNTVRIDILPKSLSKVSTKTINSPFVSAFLSSHSNLNSKRFNFVINP
jgi:hypothetical protein